MMNGRRQTKKGQTTEEKKIIRKYHTDIKDFLKQEATIIFAVDKLKALSQKRYLDTYLSQTKYWVFEWSLRHDKFSLNLLEKLNEFLSEPRQERYKFLMLSHSSYSALKKYINNILQLSLEEYQESIPMKRSILKVVIKMNPSCVSECIKITIQENEESAVAEEFSQVVDDIVNELQPEFKIEEPIEKNDRKRKREDSDVEITQYSDTKVAENGHGNLSDSAEYAASQGFLPRPPQTQKRKQNTFEDEEKPKDGHDTIQPPLSSEISACG